MQEYRNAGMQECTKLAKEKFPARGYSQLPNFRELLCGKFFPQLVGGKIRSA